MYTPKPSISSGSEAVVLMHALHQNFFQSSTYLVSPQREVSKYPMPITSNL